MGFRFLPNMRMMRIDAHWCASDAHRQMHPHGQPYSGPLNSVIAQTLWKSLVDLKCIFWDTAIISLICVLAVTVSQKILYNVMHRERQFSPGNISDCFHHPAETLPSCFPLSFSHPPPSPDQSAVLESSLQQTMACSISSAIGNNCAEYTQTTR